MSAKPEGAKSFDLSGAISLYETRPKFSGRFSHIYCGLWNGEQKVAIKVVKTINNTQSFKRKLHQERTKWARLGHPNILHFYGYATDNELYGPYGAFISPWCKYGDAATFLKEQGEALGLKTRLSLWEGVVKGTCYLHQFNPSIIHGDIKPGNVLIDDTMNVRLCDFGLLELMLEENDNVITNTNHSGSERYLAHELVVADDVVFPTMAGDIWALACVGLWFMFLRVPYADRINNLQGRIFKDIAEGKPPARRIGAGDPVISEIYGMINGVWDIFDICWAIDPRARPKATQVLSAIEKLQSSNNMTASTHRPSHSLPAINTERFRNTEELSVEKNTPIFEAIPFSTNHFVQKILFCACPLSYSGQIAFGTEDGVYIAEVQEPDRPPAKVLSLPKVTHIDVLEEASLLLVLSERNIYAFSLFDLDARSPAVDTRRVKPVTTDVSFFELGYTMGRSLMVAVRSGNESAKVKIFEPAERPKSDKGSIFRKNSQNLSQDKSTVLKLWKEFYMPTDVYSISFLKGKLCFGSPKGFQVVDLQTLGHASLINGGDESLAWIASRHKLLPLAVLRHKGEFLLCYDEFALFVDARGHRARPGWKADWDERPISFILRDPYVIAIGATSIEIRDINDSTAKQVVPAQSLRCLFAESPLEGITYQALTNPNSNSNSNGTDSNSASSSARNSSLSGKSRTSKNNRDSHASGAPSSPLSPLAPHSPVSPNGERGNRFSLPTTGEGVGGNGSGIGRHDILLSSNDNILLLKPATLSDQSHPRWSLSLDSLSSTYHNSGLI